MLSDSFGLLVCGLLDLFATEGTSVDSSSEVTLISSAVFSFGSPACESGRSVERPSSKG